MAQSGTRLVEVATEDELPGQRLGLAAPAERGLTQLLIMTLSTLSRKTVIALASLVDLALIGSVFALCLLVISSPTALQLVEAAGYAMFIGCSLWLRRR